MVYRCIFADSIRESFTSDSCYYHDDVGQDLSPVFWQQMVGELFKVTFHQTSWNARTAFSWNSEAAEQVVSDKVKVTNSRILVHHKFYMYTVQVAIWVSNSWLCVRGASGFQSHLLLTLCRLTLGTERAYTCAWDLSLDAIGIQKLFLEISYSSASSAPSLYFT